MVDEFDRKDEAIALSEHILRLTEKAFRLVGEHDLKGFEAALDTREKAMGGFQALRETFSDLPESVRETFKRALEIDGAIRAALHDRMVRERQAIEGALTSSKVLSAHGPLLTDPRTFDRRR